MSCEIHPREAKPLLEAGHALALDVREPHEWHRGHIRDALHSRSGVRSGSVVAPEPAPGTVV